MGGWVGGEEFVIVFPLTVFASSPLPSDRTLLFFWQQSVL